MTKAKQSSPTSLAGELTPHPLHLVCHFHFLVLHQKVLSLSIMRSHAYLAIIAALIAATESALPSHQERKGADQTSLLNEAILEAIKATSTSEPASFVNQVRKGAAPIRILNTNNEEMGMTKVVM